MGFACDHALQLLCHDGLAEEITLRLVAAALTQEVALLGCLDAFSDDSELERLREGDYRAHDADVVRCARHTGDKRAVDLQVRIGNRLR